MCVLCGLDIRLTSFVKNMYLYCLSSSIFLHRRHRLDIEIYIDSNIVRVVAQLVMLMHCPGGSIFECDTGPQQFNILWEIG